VPVAMPGIYARDHLSVGVPVQRDVRVPPVLPTIGAVGYTRQTPASESPTPVFVAVVVVRRHPVNG
jgi:hypothetical protein